MLKPLSVPVEATSGKKIRDRWSARRAERETETHQTAGWRVEGRRDDDGYELGVERERQGQTHRHETAQSRPQGSVRILSASLVSPTSGQLPTSAEIEEVRGLSCGASDPEFDAEEDAAREMYSQSDL